MPIGSVPPRLLAALGAAIALPAALAAATPAAAASATPTPAAATSVAATPAAAALAISPAPGTPDASPSTQVSVLGLRPDRIRSVRVRGALSGQHPGTLEPYSARRGASFVLKRPLDQGERVAVSVRIAGRAPISFSFTVARLAATPPVLNIPLLQPAKLDHFVSLPGLLPPRIQVHRGRASPGGDIFLTPLPAPVVHPESNNAITINPVGPGGPMIIDSRGRLVWFDQLKPPMVATNFRPQRFAGHEVLSWWQGPVTTSAFGLGEDVIADTSYGTLRTVRAGNGYPTDLHEFVLTRSGDALLTVYSPVLVHLQGTPKGKLSPLLDSLVQEVDIRTGLVVWEWHAFGHIPLSDSYATPANSANYDAFHLNSIEALPGGRVLVSARDTCAVYLIARAGGRIVWTLGGKASSFRMARGARFYFQHDAQMAGRDEVSLFDDEAGPPIYAPSSRGLLLGLDSRHHTAEVVRQYHRPGTNTSADSEGSAQYLPGGNVFVGFGSTPGFSEFSPGGKLVFDATLPTDDGSYRVYRFPWSATPRTVPVVVARRAGPKQVSVYTSWNGATTVARWQVLAGRTAASLAPVAAVPDRRFETRIDVTSGNSLFAVRALSGSGRILATSVPVTAS